MIQNKINRSNCFILLEFLAIYAVSSTVSTALDNIAIVLLILATIYEYYKNRDEKILFPERMFNVCYWPFFVLIILAAFLIGYQDSMKDTLKLVRFSVIAFFTFYFALQRQFHEHAIISGVAIGLLTICAFALQQFYQFPLGTRLAGNFAQPNNGCMILILSVPFVAMYATWKKNISFLRLLVGLATIISCAVVAMTGSRGGIMGLCLGGIILLLVQTLYVRKLAKNKLLTIWAGIFAVLICVGGTYYLYFHNHPPMFMRDYQQTEANVSVQSSQPVQQAVPATMQKKSELDIKRSYDNERILMWKSSWQMWKDHKLYGVGLWHWNEEYKAHYISTEAREPNLSFPHNIFVSFFSMTGLLGGVGYILFSIGMFIYLCYKLKQYPDDIFLNALIWSLLAVTLHGAVDVGILYRHAMILYSAYLGVGLGSVAYREQKEKE